MIPTHMASRVSIRRRRPIQAQSDSSILILWLKEYLRLVLLSCLEHQEDLHLHQHLKMSDHINQDLVLEHLHQLARLQVHRGWINGQYIFLSMLGYYLLLSWHPPNSTKTSFEQGISTVIAGHHMLLSMFFIHSLWETKGMESAFHSIMVSDCDRSKGFHPFLLPYVCYISTTLQVRFDTGSLLGA